MTEKIEQYLEKSSKQEKERFDNILSTFEPIQSGDREKALEIWNENRLIDTRIRGIKHRTWEDFKLHCLEESARRKKRISVNTRLKEMIDMVLASK